MDIINETPFPFIEFESHTPNDRPFHTLVLQATFAIEPDKRVRAVTDQGAVRLHADGHAGTWVVRVGA